jgi:hypothetical protein
MDPVDLVKAAKIEGGFYKGKPASPDTVKFTVDFQGLKIKVDRPKGFIMIGVDSNGQEWKRQYKVDYGFIPKTLGGDDDGLDVFIGPNKDSKQAFWVVQKKDDGSFDEYKAFLGFDNRDEAIATYRAHIHKKYFGRMITITVEMMKAMLGTNPEEVVSGVKTAYWPGFVSELRKLADTTEFGEDIPGMHYPQSLLQYQQAVLPRITSPKHPGNKYLKVSLLNALLQGALGSGS